MSWPLRGYHVMSWPLVRDYHVMPWPLRGYHVMSCNGLCHALTAALLSVRSVMCYRCHLLVIISECDFCSTLSLSRYLNSPSEIDVRGRFDDIMISCCYHGMCWYHAAVILCISIIQCATGIWVMLLHCCVQPSCFVFIILCVIIMLYACNALYCCMLLSPSMC